MTLKVQQLCEVAWKNTGRVKKSVKTVFLILYEHHTYNKIANDTVTVIIYLSSLLVFSVSE